MKELHGFLPRRASWRPSCLKGRVLAPVCRYLINYFFTCTCPWNFLIVLFFCLIVYPAVWYILSKGSALISELELYWWIGIHSHSVYLWGCANTRMISLGQFRLLRRRDHLTGKRIDLPSTSFRTSGAIGCTLSPLPKGSIETSGVRSGIRVQIGK